MPPLGEVVETKTKQPGSSGGDGRNDDHEGVSVQVVCMYGSFVEKNFNDHTYPFSLFIVPTRMVFFFQHNS